MGSNEAAEQMVQDYLERCALFGELDTAVITQRDGTIVILAPASKVDTLAGAAPGAQIPSGKTPSGARAGSWGAGEGELTNVTHAVCLAHQYLACLPPLDANYDDQAGELLVAAQYASNVLVQCVAENVVITLLAKRAPGRCLGSLLSIKNGLLSLSDGTNRAVAQLASA